jgi:quercetin dioxygenase-like cupin family protein
MSRTRTAITTLALAAAFGLGALTTADSAPTAKRTALAAVDNPIGAKGRTLGLSRVVVPAGAVLALHHHTGSQIAYIDAGTLTYTVKSGSVPVYKGQADGTQKLVRRITAGHTALISQGHWLVEQPNVVHMAANRGNGFVEIHLANLLPIGDPPSVPNR